MAEVPQEQSDVEVIDFKLNERILSVMPKEDDQYQILSASIHGVSLEKEDMKNLLKLATGYVDNDYQETKLYDEEFIEHLKNVFFNLYQSRIRPTHHIPILLSIEGNIGAGKSTYINYS